MRKSFTLEEYVDILLFGGELSDLVVDALCAVEGRYISFATFCDFSGGSLGHLLSNMEYFQAAGDAQGRGFPSWSGNITFLVNFPAFWKTCLNMLAAGSGYAFEFEVGARRDWRREGRKEDSKSAEQKLTPPPLLKIIVPGTDLKTKPSITDAVDISLLPKAIGGDAVNVDENGEKDERCARGSRHPSISVFLKGLVE